jgi:CRP/FNR family transcriptional regulator, anaerobic regulatory protein
MSGREEDSTLTRAGHSPMAGAASRPPSGSGSQLANAAAGFPETSAMADSARFALHRPELHDSLVRGDEKIQALMKGSERTLRAAEVLIEANTEHRYVYRLVSGWTSRSRMFPDARDQCILVFLPGDLFAVKSMFVNRHMDDVLALADSVVQQIDHRELYRAYLSDGDIASRCTWQILEEERRLHSWVAGLGLGSADERLALLMMDFHGRLALSGTIPPDALSFSMPLTQVQLGQHVGLTPVHVNRVLRSFREQGILTVRNGEVRIDNMEKLSRLAYPLLDPYERKTPEYHGGAAG